MIHMKLFKIGSNGARVSVQGAMEKLKEKINMKINNKY